jgi:hypothetical protein
MLKGLGISNPLLSDYTIFFGHLLAQFDGVETDEDLPL